MNRTALTIFAVVLALAIVAAFMTTIHGVDTRVASNEAVPGITGLSQSHIPLDTGPGRAVQK
jgi:hypothetical protein